MMLYGRKLEGKKATLPGFENVREGMMIPMASPKEGEALEGTVYEVSEEELSHTDLYEGSAYKRIKAMTEAGEEVYVYVQSSSYRQEGI